MSDSKPGRASDQFALRMPDGMRDRIKAAADASGRSMNAEIVATLAEKYPAPPPDAYDAAKLEDLFIRLRLVAMELRRDDLQEGRRASVSARFDAVANEIQRMLDRRRVELEVDDLIAFHDEAEAHGRR